MSSAIENLTVNREMFLSLEFSPDADNQIWDEELVCGCVKGNLIRSMFPVRDAPSLFAPNQWIFAFYWKYFGHYDIGPRRCVDTPDIEKPYPGLREYMHTKERELESIQHESKEVQQQWKEEIIEKLPEFGVRVV